MTDAQKIEKLTCAKVTAEIKKALRMGDRRRAFDLYNAWGKFDDYTSRASKVRHTKLYNEGFRQRGQTTVAFIGTDSENFIPHNWGNL